MLLVSEPSMVCRPPALWPCCSLPQRCSTFLTMCCCSVMVRHRCRACQATADCHVCPVLHSCTAAACMPGYACTYLPLSRHPACSRVSRLLASSDHTCCEHGRAGSTLCPSKRTAVQGLQWRPYKLVKQAFSRGAWAFASDSHALKALHAGHVVYHGPREACMGFFNQQGFQLPARKGVADFLQEVTSLKVRKPAQPPHSGPCDIRRCMLRSMQLDSTIPLWPFCYETYAVTALVSICMAKQCSLPSCPLQVSNDRITARCSQLRSAEPFSAAA